MSCILREAIRQRIIHLVYVDIGIHLQKKKKKKKKKTLSVIQSDFTKLYENVIDWFL